MAKSVRKQFKRSSPEVQAMLRGEILPTAIVLDEDNVITNTSDSPLQEITTLPSSRGGPEAWLPNRTELENVYRYAQAGMTQQGIAAKMGYDDQQWITVKQRLPLLKKVIALAKANRELESLGNVVDIADNPGSKQLEANKVILDRVAPIRNVDQPIVNIIADTVHLSDSELLEAQRELLRNADD